MDKFVFKDHTADVQFSAYGFSFEEALSNAALAMFTVMANVGALGEGEKVKIEEKAETLEELVGYTLGDILSESSSQEIFFSRFVVDSFCKQDGGYALAGTAFGEAMTPGKGRTDVKAVTMHEISVCREGSLWKITVLLDI
jgi:SHS2 domain-containing protein